MARSGSIKYSQVHMRKYIRNRRKNQQVPQSSGNDELQKYYQQCSLVLIAGAAGWIDEHSATLTCSSRSSTRWHQKFVHAGLSDKEAACLDYICSEYDHIDGEVFFSERAPLIARFTETFDLTRLEIRSTIDALKSNFERYSSAPRTALLPPELQSVLDEVSRQLCLTSVERDVFAISLVISMVRCSFSHFSISLSGLTPRLCAAVVAKLTGHPEQLVLNAFSSSGSLARVGILDAEDCLEGEHLKEFLRLGERFRRWVAEETTKENPRYELLTQVKQTQLNSSDFEHLSAELNLARNILLGAMDEGKQGINILLVGPPGSGKSEVAKVVADAVGAKLLQVDFVDTSGSQLSLDASERLKSFNLGQRLLAKVKNSLLLFDEIEDVLDEPFLFLSKGLGRSKAFTNNLLETNPVPTIWVANRLRRMDPAWLRRFSFVLEVPVPPRAARERILKRILSGLKHPLRISNEMERRIVDVEGLSAGQLKVAMNALDCERMTVGEGVLDEQLETLLREPLRLAHGLNGLPKAGRYQMYDIAFLNTNNANVSHVVEGIERNPRARILLSGPPGTGKTGFAHFVAQRLGKPLLRKTAADILGSYVGETERAIAAMFAEAARNDCVLLLDEADGLMRNRQSAVRQWEVTQVNELLSRMEDFPGIFFCSTNHLENLDPATMRRFLFRLEFSYLTEEQAVSLLKTHVKFDCSGTELDSAKDTIRQLQMLTPADFSNVRNRLNFLGVDLSLQHFLDHLKQEVSSKTEENTRKVGFGGEL